MAERWHGLVEAHLSALGARPTLAPSGWCLHLLLVPTFHRPCWLSFHENGLVLELELVVLQESISFSPGDPLQPGKRRCWEDLVQVSEAQRSALHAVITTIDIVGMENAELAARDGLFMQCWYSDATISHHFIMTSPTPTLAPRHHRLVQVILSTALASTNLSEMQLSLQHLLRSLAYQ